MKSKAVSAEMIETVRRLRAANVSWDDCGSAVDLSRETVRKLLDPEYRERRRVAVNECRVRRYWELKKPSSRTLDLPPVRPPAEVLADALRRRSLVRPTITSQFFGDPLPGYSALDRRR